MTNHVHIAVQAGIEPLAGFMRFVASKYAKSFNRKVGRTGHLFERRYRAILIQEDAYLKELVRYIHLNPVRAEMVWNAADYPWSSHHAYAGAIGPRWLTTRQILAQFGATQQAARRGYAKFMGKQQSTSVIKLLRVGFEKDDRVLGDDNWRSEILNKLEQKSERRSKSLDEIVHEKCGEHGVTETELGSPSRARRFVRIRAEIALEATENGAASLTKIAERFGRSQPALSRTLRKLRRKAE
jgi:DNA-binding transcriptional ArsR family regulator